MCRSRHGRCKVHATVSGALKHAWRVVISSVGNRTVKLLLAHWSFRGLNCATKLNFRTRRARTSRDCVRSTDQVQGQVSLKSRWSLTNERSPFNTKNEAAEFLVHIYTVSLHSLTTCIKCGRGRTPTFAIIWSPPAVEPSKETCHPPSTAPATSLPKQLRTYHSAADDVITRHPTGDQLRVC